MNSEVDSLKKIAIALQKSLDEEKKDNSKLRSDHTLIRHEFDRLRETMMSSITNAIDENIQS